MPNALRSSADIACTLQTARQPMQMRLAWVAADHSELRAGLKAFVAAEGRLAGPALPAAPARPCRRPG